jgi:hypothetical protein
MSNVKISQLPVASTINPAADVAPIVHSGVTQKATPNLIVQSVLPSPGPIGSVTPNTAQFASLTLSGASGLQKAVAGLFTDAVAGTDYLGPTAGSAIQKANGSGGLTSAVSGTDYAPATSGTSILYGNGAGGFSNVTVGSGLSFSAGTLASTSSGGSVTSVSVVTANGLAGTVANATSTPAITLSTTVTGLLKGNGTAISAAVAGTDYAAAPTGTNAQLLANNGSGGFSNVTVGSGLTYTAGTLAVTGGGGTVTDVSVVSANGFAGTVATSTTTPAITLSTSVSGLLKGNGTAVSAAVSGTDYAPATSGSSVLYGNGAGGFSNVSIGSNMTFSGGVLNANATTSIVGSPGYYGSFYDNNATQVAANTTTAYPIKINSTFEANGVSIANDGSGNPTRVTFANAGVYNFQYSIQLTNTDSSIHNVNVWLRKNNTSNVADSNSQYAVVGSHGGINGQLIAAVNFVFTAAANDFFEIMWQPESTQVYIETIPAGTTPTTPVAPGVIVTACQQAQIGVGYYGLTSSTSTLIGTGSKTFTTNFDSTATAFTVGTRVRLAYSVTPANYMEGVITSFSGTTLVVNVDNTGGSGTYASWTVSVAGNLASMVYPGAGIPNSTGSAWGTSYSTTGSGTVVALATSPTLVTPVLGTPTSGTLSNCTVDGTDSVGFRNIPQISQSANYTTVLTDSGKHIFHPSTDTNARTFTIDSNANVAYPVGTAITFVNMSSSAVTIAITSDTMYLAATGSTGSRTLAQYGTATALKIASTTWLINGNGLT